MIVCFDTNVPVSAVSTRGLYADRVNTALAELQLVVRLTVPGRKFVIVALP